jgi:HEAT repeat protein
MRTPVDETDESVVLTVKLLRELLASGKDADFRKIVDLLNRGAVEEPFVLAEMLIAHIDKGGNYGFWMSKCLPLLKDDRVREKIATDLLARLGTLTDRNGITGALQAIGKVGGPENVPDLAKIARSHEMRDAVARALYALADIGGKEAATELVAYLRENIGNNDRQPLALRAIENMKTPEMVAAIGGLIDDEDPKVQLIGVNALGQAAGTKAATDKLLDLWKKGGDLGRAAGLQLGKATGKEATDRFLEEIDQVEDVNVRVQMIRGLGRNGSEPARAKCDSLLRDPDEKEAARGEAAASLAQMGDKRGVQVMIDIVSNPRSESRLLDRKVLKAIVPLAHKNQDAAKEFREKLLPVLKRRLKENPTDTNTHQLKMAIVRLELAGMQPK